MLVYKEVDRGVNTQQVYQTQSGGNQGKLLRSAISEEIEGPEGINQNIKKQEACSRQTE